MSQPCPCVLPSRTRSARRTQDPAAIMKSIGGAESQRLGSPQGQWQHGRLPQDFAVRLVRASACSWHGSPDYGQKLSESSCPFLKESCCSRRPRSPTKSMKATHAYKIDAMVKKLPGSSYTFLMIDWVFSVFREDPDSRRHHHHLLSHTAFCRAYGTHASRIVPSLRHPCVSLRHSCGP